MSKMLKKCSCTSTIDRMVIFKILRLFLNFENKILHAVGPLHASLSTKNVLRKNFTNKKHKSSESAYFITGVTKQQ